MECTVPDCGGACEPTTISQFYPGKRPVTVAGVPAEVCALCGQPHLAPATQARLRELLHWAQSIRRRQIMYNDKPTSSGERRTQAVRREEPLPLPPARHKRHPRKR